MDGNRKPHTIQEHIDYYREEKLRASNPNPNEENEADKLNFFEVPI